MKSFFYSVLLVTSTASTSYGQAYSFAIPDDLLQLVIRYENDAVECFYEVTEKNSPVSTFRKVLLDESLTPLDSIEYSFPGSAELIGSSSGKEINFYAFHLHSKKSDSVRIITTEKSGAIRSSCTIPLQDFAPAFEAKSIKAPQLHLSFIGTNSEIALIQPYLEKVKADPGKIIQLRLHDGQFLWMQASAPLDRFVLIGNRVAGIRKVQDRSRLDCLDLQTGSILYSVPFGSRESNREVSSIGTYENKLVIAGTEQINGHRQFCISILDIDGQELYHYVDPSEILSGGRMRPIGQFYHSGDIFTICEGWKLDNSGKVARALASSVAYNFGLPRSLTGAPIDFSITSLIAVKTNIQRESTEVSVFPIGPYAYYSQFATNNRESILVSGDNFILFEPDEEEFPVTRFRKSPSEGLLFTPSNAVMFRLDDKKVHLRAVNVHRER